MKTKLFFIGMLFAVSMVSCRKENDALIPTSANKNVNDQVSTLRETKMPLCKLIAADDGTERSFLFDEQKRLVYSRDAQGVERKFLYDKLGRVATIFIFTPDRSSRLQIAYEKSNSSRQIKRFETGIDGKEILVARIMVKLNANGQKVAEQEMPANAAAGVALDEYGYNDEGQLIWHTKSIDGVQVEGMKIYEFAPGVNELAEVTELAMEPGVAHQTGNPQNEILWTAEKQLDKSFEYELNDLGQPLKIISTDSEGLQMIFTLEYN